MFIAAVFFGTKSTIAISASDNTAAYPRYIHHVARIQVQKLKNVTNSVESWWMVAYFLYCREVLSRG
jgi:hypothetical protein